jgi:hypothetical protein
MSVKLIEEDSRMSYFSNEIKRRIAHSPTDINPSFPSEPHGSIYATVLFHIPEEMYYYVAVTSENDVARRKGTGAQIAKEMFDELIRFPDSQMLKFGGRLENLRNVDGTIFDGRKFDEVVSSSSVSMHIEDRYNRGLIMKVDPGAQLAFPRSRYTYLINNRVLTLWQVKKIFSMVGRPPSPELRRVGDYLLTNVIDSVVLQNNAGSVDEPEYDAVTRIIIKFKDPEITIDFDATATYGDRHKLAEVAYELIKQLKYDEDPEFERQRQQRSERRD